jgi:hypothetical protein
MNDKQQRFFEFMLNENGLILTSEEMNEIAFEAKLFHSPDEIEEQPQPEQPRPFRPGQLVKWVQPSGIKPGIVRAVATDISGIESSVIVEFPDGQDEFSMDGRYSYFDLEPSLFHI